MNQNELIETILSAMCKVQSAIHDLDELPDNSIFKQQMKRSCNDMLRVNRNFVSNFEIVVDGTCRKFDVSASDTYIDIVEKITEIGKEVKLIFKEEEKQEA